jgi:hypothetical protein
MDIMTRPLQGIIWLSFFPFTYHYDIVPWDCFLHTFSFLFSDMIGVISHVGPFEYASPTSQHKLEIIKIRNLEYFIYLQHCSNLPYETYPRCLTYNIPHAANKHKKYVFGESMARSGT